MAGSLSRAPICWLGGECGTALGVRGFHILRPLLFFPLLCENWVLQILKQVDCCIQAGAAPVRRKAQVPSCEKCHFLLHRTPTCCLTFCHLRFNMIAQLIRWVWQCRLLKLSVCLLSCPLSSYLKMTVYKCRSKCWHDLLPALLLQSWRWNTYSWSNVTWGKHQVWETLSLRVQVCKSCKRMTRGGTMESVRQPE